MLFHPAFLNLSAFFFLFPVKHINTHVFLQEFQKCWTHAPQKALNIYLSYPFCQKGKEREHNQHWSRKCWEKSGIKLKRRLKARDVCHHLIQRYTFSKGNQIMMPSSHGDNRTKRERVQESFLSIHGAINISSFILPDHKCKVSVSISLHKSLLCWMERPWSKDLPANLCWL